MAQPISLVKEEEICENDINPRTWSYRIYFTVMLFSISATVGIDALWVTSPVSSCHLPEGHSTAAYLVCMILLGNVTSFAYLIGRKCVLRMPCQEVIPIYVCLTTGIIASVLLALFWDQHSLMRHKDHSLVYLGCSICLTQVASLACVTYVPFVSRMKEEYISAVLLGEAIAGFIPHVVSIGQGIGEPPACRPERPEFRNWTVSGWRARLRPTTTLAPIVPPPLRFNESIYYFVITGVICVAGFGFLVLRCIPSVRYEYDEVYVDYMEEAELVRTGRGQGIEDEHDDHWSPHTETSIAHPVILDDGTIRHTMIHGGGVNSLGHAPDIKINKARPPLKPPRVGSSVYTGLLPIRQGRQRSPAPSLSRHASPSTKKHNLSPYTPPSLCLMLAITFWACLVINGPLSSVKANACIPLGNRAYLSGTLMTKVGSVIAVCVSLRVNPYSRTTMVIAFTSLGTILLTYFVALIAFSHESDSKEDSPIFGNTGEFLSVS